MFIDITAKQLDERFQFQKTAMAKQFPLLMKYLWVGAENLNWSVAAEPSA